MSDAARRPPGGSDVRGDFDAGLLPLVLASIVDIAADAVIIIDASQRIRFFNSGAEQIFGWTAAEMLGQTLDVLLPAAVHAAHRRHVQDFASTGTQARRMAERRRIAGRRKSGEEFPAEASIAHTQIGPHHLYAVVLRDATERYRVESEQRWLAQTGRVLANSIELWPSMSAIAQRVIPSLADWAIVELLPPAVPRPAVLIAHRDPGRDVARERLSDAMRAHRAGQTLDDPVDDGTAAAARTPPPGDAAAASSGDATVPRTDDAAAAPASEASVPRTSDALLVARSGEAVLLTGDLTAWVESTFGPAIEEATAVETLDAGSVLLLPLFAGGRALGVMHLVRGRGRVAFSANDLSLAERFSTSAALTLDNARLYEESRETIRERDDLLAIVSHDLRNPVSAIVMLTGALLRAAPLDAESVEVRVEQLEALRGAARQSDGLIADLRDVSLIRAGRLRIDPAVVRASDIVRDAMEVFAPLADDRGFQLLQAVEPNLPFVRAERRRAVQLLSNFLGNAVKFSPEEAPIIVRAERAGPTAVRFSVRDQGPGIAAADQPRLFERYFQATRLLRSGSGLGLFIAKGIAEAHGGEIGVDTAPGAGSTFWFTLPVVPSEGTTAAS